MTNFLTKGEEYLSKEFEKKGYVIKDIEDKDSLLKIRNIFFDSIKKNLGKSTKFTNVSDLLNYTHKEINFSKLNEFRMKVLNEINKKKEIRKLYYNVSKSTLDILLGNEIAMQLRINLSIQFPKDKSSLLPVHSDVWSGDSPFETVVWLPLVDCYNTKSMYILPPEKYKKVREIFNTNKTMSSEQIYKKIKKDLTWIDIKYGQVMVFNQCLPHGNTINREKETRWSLNCRFKSIFTPYRDKKIGEFFEPITLRKISELAIQYNLPKIKK